MHAYIDESGNTGFNLFDPAQPYFLNVAMSSPVDFDKIFQERVKHIAHSAGVEYLHASEMGVHGVETIAQSVIELIEFSQVRFYFACINKPDIAAMKFYDAIFDPGENPAASHHSYVIRGLKFLLLLKFVAILDSDDTRLFWKAMTSTRTSETEMEAVSAIDNVMQRVCTLPDSRSRQLVRDTLYWARNNISEFSFWTPRKQDRYGHLPNLFTFPALFESISQAAKGWGSEVDMIIHDQQSQFEKTLREWHSLFVSAEPERILHFGDTPIQFADIRNSQFEMRDSRVSPGLQIVDIVLWTLSRTVANKPLGPISTELYELCFSPKDMFFMSLDWIVAELSYTMSALVKQPMSEDQLLEGMRVIDHIEQLRQRRITEDMENQASVSRRATSVSSPISTSQPQ